MKSDVIKHPTFILRGMSREKRGAMRFSGINYLKIDFPTHIISFQNYILVA